MSSAEATGRTRPRHLEGLGRRAVTIAVGVAGVVVLGLGWSWHSHIGSRASDHWEAVARARTYLARNRPDLALQAVVDVRDEGPGAGEAMTIAGVAMARYGQFREARIALERALRLQPNQLDAAKALAELNMRIGNGAGATHALEIAARLDPNDGRLWRALGKVYHDLADPSNAARAFKKAALLRDDDLEALVGLIRELLNAHEVERAETWLARATKSHPGNPAILGLEARLLCELGRYDEAISRADRSLAAEPNDLNALLARGRSRMALARWEDALADVERAASVAPDNLNTLAMLLLVETRLGLADRATATRKKRLETQERVQLMGRLTKEMEEHPDDPELRWKLGQAAMEGGQVVLASRCFEAALALDPGHRQAREGLDSIRKGQPGAVPARQFAQPRRPPLSLPPGASLASP